MTGSYDASLNPLTERFSFLSFTKTRRNGAYIELASSQALPALKVAIDDECSGKGLAFTKNNPPDFGLLFLAQLARFSIRTETEVTVHTHSQTNRHSHLCPARSGLWKFGFVGPLASNARWAGSISDQASGPAAEPVQTVNVELGAHFYEK